MNKPPTWIKKSQQRAKKWLLEDISISEKKWQSLSYDTLMKLPIIQTLNLNPSGGRVRFPGSDSEDHTFSFTVIKKVKIHGGELSRGELFIGIGKTLEDAVRSAIQVTIELLSLRGNRKS